MCCGNFNLHFWFQSICSKNATTFLNIQKSYVCSICTDYVKIQVTGLLQFSAWWLLNTEHCFLKVTKFLELISQVCGKYMNMRLTFICIDLNCTQRCVSGSNMCLKGHAIGQISSSFIDHFSFSVKYPVRGCIVTISSLSTTNLHSWSVSGLRK